MTAPHVYPEPTLLTCRHGRNNADGCCDRCGMTWGEQAAEREWARRNDPVDGRDPDDGPWISERDIDDQIAGRHFPLNGRGASE
jgi:hypothetical protein